MLVVLVHGRPCIPAPKAKWSLPKGERENNITNVWWTEKVRLDLVHAVILHLTTTYNMCEGIQLIWASYIRTCKQNFCCWPVKLCFYGRSEITHPKFQPPSVCVNLRVHTHRYLPWNIWGTELSVVSLQRMSETRWTWCRATPYKKSLDFKI